MGESVAFGWRAEGDECRAGQNDRRGDDDGGLEEDDFDDDGLADDEAEDLADQGPPSWDDLPEEDDD